MRLRDAMRDFIAGEAAGGLVLIAASAAALVAANSPLAAAYFAALHAPAGMMSVQHWINDGLMALFFLLVGLEVRAELTGGALASATQRRLPVIAALSGMAVPALVYALIAAGTPGLLRGWAIPAATDIAFALALLAMLGRHAPPSLKLLLTTIAVADDIGAVAIIAVAYTATLDGIALAGAGLALAWMYVCRRAGIVRLPVYLALALLLWLAVLLSGVHATVAGVATAFLLPRATCARLEHALHPWVAFGVVPLFGFANAGVSLGGLTPAALVAPLPLAIALGLFLGKQAGVFGGIWLAVRLKLAPRPHGASWLQLYGLALLAGIGFTMSLFIGGLAFPGRADLESEVKIGVLAGSLLSALAGYAVLRSASTATTSTPSPPSESSAPTQPVDVQP